MTIVNIDPAQPPARRGGRPKGSTGNGKTAQEKKARALRNFEVERTEIEISAQRDQLEIVRDLESARLGQKRRVMGLFTEQERKRAPQFQIDQRGTLYLLIGLAAFTFLTNALLTADGTIGAAAAARFGISWFSYILFGSFEVGILATMLMYYIRGSRVDMVTGKRVRAGQWFAVMVALSILTVSLSAYHVLDLYKYDFTSINMYVGIGIRLAVSVLFVIVAKGIAGVLFAKAVDANELTKVGA